MATHTTGPGESAAACARVAPLLDAYHDGELRGGRQATVARHVVRCARCRDALAGLERLRATLRAPVEAELAAQPTADLWERISHALDADAREAAALARRRVLRPVAALAVAVLVGAVALLARPAQVQHLNVASDDFRVDSIEVAGGGVMVLEAPDTGMKIIWVIETANGESTEAAS